MKMAKTPDRPLFRLISEGPTSKARCTTGFAFVSWRSDRRAFFLLDSRGKKLVATPNLPRLSEGWQFPKMPFPECAVVELRPYRLIPPPIGASKDDDPALRHLLLGGGAVPAAWELRYGQYLFADASDEPALRQLLKKRNSIRRRQHEKLVKEGASWTREEVRRCLKGKRRSRPAEELTPEKVLADLRDPDRSTAEDITDAEFEAFCEQRRRLPGELGLNKPLTMEDVHRNTDGLLSDYLHGWWAKDQGFELNRLGWEDRDGHRRGWRRDPAEFLAWVKRHCSVHPLGWDLEMELLATVRFVAEFANGERIFLAGLETREPRADEIEEFLKVLATERSAAPAEPVLEFPAWQLVADEKGGKLFRYWDESGDRSEVGIGAVLFKVLKFASKQADLQATWRELQSTEVLRPTNGDRRDGTKTSQLREQKGYRKLVQFGLVNDSDNGFRLLIAPRH